MKNQVYIILGISLIFLWGCTNNSNDISKSLINSDFNSKIIDSISINSENTISQETFDEIGNNLMKNESIWGIKKDMQSNNVIEIIGYPDEKSTAEEWGSDGQIHQKWTYANQNVELDMIGAENSNQVVNSIYVKSPSDAKTSRNIGIGSNITDVTNKYSNEIDKSQTTEFQIVAGTIYGGIVFTFENKKVTSIFIGASAE
ncbi:MAG: hypothetical protein HY951_01360 [Bacteroidia bacterium]|nr:hypothetical protein [Bacteroidia bacterium]